MVNSSKPVLVGVIFTLALVAVAIGLYIFFSPMSNGRSLAPRVVKLLGILPSTSHQKHMAGGYLERTIAVA